MDAIDFYHASNNCRCDVRGIDWTTFEGIFAENAFEMFHQSKMDILTLFKAQLLT